MAEAGIVLGALSPHPPIVVPEIGEDNIGRVGATRDGLQQLANLITDMRPDTVVIVSPHGPVLQGAMTLLASPILEGNFREFDIAGTSLRYGNDLRLVNRTVAEAAERDVSVYAADPDRAPSFRFPSALHYSVLVPLYYLKQAGYEGRLMAGATGLIPDDQLVGFGRSVAAAARELGIRVVYLASGDLSHRLTDGAPAGFDPMGKVFDQKIVSALARGDFAAVRNLEPELIERAGECGLGPILTLAGALEDREVLPQVYSYEGPFGVGYCVASFTPTGPARKTAGSRADEQAAARPAKEAAPAPPAEKPATGRPAVPAETTETGPASLAGAPEGEEPEDELNEAEEPASPGDEPADAASEDAEATGGAVHPLVRLARLSLESYVMDGQKIAPPPGSPGLDRRAGAFVSLKKRGELRGCIGTISATEANLAEEVIRNAISAGTGDPRFPPVRPEELAELDYSVDVLEPAERVSSLAELDPKVYGVIVAKDRRTGLLLPDLEGVDTVEEQVYIAMQKAGIRPDEKGVSLYRFKVTRYH